MPNSTGNAPIYRQSLVEKYVERYVEGNMTARIRIERGVRPNHRLLYEGRARVHLLAGAVQMGFGDESQYMVSGTISVPRLSDTDDFYVLPMIHDLVTVLEHNDDRVVGHTFWVQHVDAGGQWNQAITMSVVGSEDSGTVTDRPLAPVFPEQP